MGRKAVFMDIDGTLMERGRVSPRVIGAIKAARAQGHLFFVCTGRAKGFLPQMLRAADYLDGFVMACGMHCEMSGEVVHRKRVDIGVLLEVARYFCENGRECLFEGETKILGLNSERADCENYHAFDGIAEAFEREPISKITIVGPYQEADDIFLSRWFTMYDMSGWSDVVVKGVSKATGIQRMLERVGVPREDCIAIGDGTNDLPMIEFAGLGVAMGNAPEGVKAAADAVTESCENDGVAVMIEKYVLG